MVQTAHRHHDVPEFLLKEWAPNSNDSSVRSAALLNADRNASPATTAGFRRPRLGARVQHVS